MVFGPDSIVEFVTITRGGAEGLVAVLEIDGEHKYFELIGLQSILKICQNKKHALAIQAAMQAMNEINNIDDIPEFEGGLPVQGSLF